MSNYPPQQFVNLHGQPITATQGAARRSSRSSAIREPKHKGFAAVGYSPVQLSNARAEHERMVERAIASGAPAPAPWSAESYMRRHPGTRIRRAPYSVPSAAQEACDLAVRYGWLNCRVEPVITK